MGNEPEDVARDRADRDSACRLRERRFTGADDHGGGPAGSRERRLAARTQRPSRRSCHSLRHAAQRHALCDHAQRHAAGRGLASPALRHRLVGRGRGPARGRAFRRAPRTQRDAQRARGRVHPDPRAARAPVRPGHQCDDELRPDRLHARSAPGRAGDGRHRPLPDARGSGRGDADPRSDRPRAQRRPLGGAHPRDPRLPGADRRIHQPVPRRSASEPLPDRLNRRDPDRDAGARARLLRRILPPGTGHPGRSRRFRRRRDGGQDPDALRRLARPRAGCARRAPGTARASRDRNPGLLRGRPSHPRDDELGLTLRRWRRHPGRQFRPGPRASRLLDPQPPSGAAGKRREPAADRRGLRPSPPGPARRGRPGGSGRPPRPMGPGTPDDRAGAAPRNRARLHPGRARPRDRRVPDRARQRRGGRCDPDVAGARAIDRQQPQRRGCDPESGPAARAFRSGGRGDHAGGGP